MSEGKSRLTTVFNSDVSLMNRQDLRQSRRSCLFIRDILQNVLDAAREDLADVVERGGGDVPIMLQGVQCSAAERVIFDKHIGSDAFTLHGFP